MRILTLLIFCSSFARCQDISGLWSGTIESKGSSFPYELVIYKVKEKWKGYALINFQIDGRNNPGIKEVELKFKKNNFILEDDKMIYESFHSSSRRSKLYAVLSLRNDSASILQGSFSTRSLDMRSLETYSGKLTLQKQGSASPLLLPTYLTDLQHTQSIAFLNKDVLIPDIQNKNKPEKNPSPIQNKETIASSKLIDSINFISKTQITTNKNTNAHIRKTEILHEFEIDTDSITLTLYDNGEIDGDVVSVFVNEQLVLSKQKLNDKPSRFHISMSDFKTNALDIVMFAETLGFIPPNTGLLLLEYAGQKREIRFSCDLKKNAGVLLKRKKKE